MYRSRLIIFLGVLGIVAAFLVAIVVFPAVRPARESENIISTPSSSGAPSFVSTASATTPFGGNAFAPQATQSSPSDFLARNASSQLSQPSSNPQAGRLSFQGKPVTTLDGVARIVASATVSAAASGTPSTVTVSLPLPDVPDGQISIDSKGVATAMDFLSYFNRHYKDVVFDGQKFSGVLKDKNGVVLFVPSLIDKAIADNNFMEIHDSLSVQKDFAMAEIIFLKSIKVTGRAVAIDKEVIGLEELTVQVVNNAMSVAEGTLSRSNFLSFYGQFNATALNARENFVAESGILSLVHPQSPGIASRLFAMSGIGARAMAQNPLTPFGGTVLLILPCPCDLGVNVTIGPPVPASVFVPSIFLATPFFFSYKALVIGVWWLGVDDELTQIPCAGLPVCEPTDLGAEIIMAGTSPPLP